MTEIQNSFQYFERVTSSEISNTISTETQIQNQSHFATLSNQSFNSTTSNNSMDTNNISSLNRNNNTVKSSKETVPHIIDQPTLHLTQKSKEKKPSSKGRFNYASLDAGAAILDYSPNAKGAQTILLENDDKYLRMPCNEPKQFVVQLSEDIMIESVMLNNVEHYSSSVRSFQLLASEKQPTEHWILLGDFEAKNERNIRQYFSLENHVQARFLKFRILSHWGTDFYCTLTQIGVHGTTILENFRNDMELSHDEVEKSREDYIRSQNLEKEKERENVNQSELAVGLKNSSLDHTKVVNLSELNLMIGVNGTISGEENVSVGNKEKEAVCDASNLNTADADIGKRRIDIADFSLSVSLNNKSDKINNTAPVSVDWQNFKNLSDINSITQTDNYSKILINRANENSKESKPKNGVFIKNQTFLKTNFTQNLKPDSEINVCFLTNNYTNSAKQHLYSYEQSFRDSIEKISYLGMCSVSRNGDDKEYRLPVVDNEGNFRLSSSIFSSQSVSTQGIFKSLTERIKRLEINISITNERCNQHQKIFEAFKAKVEVELNSLRHVFDIMQHEITEFIKFRQKEDVDKASKLLIVNKEEDVKVKDDLIQNLKTHLSHTQLRLEQLEIELQRLKDILLILTFFVLISFFLVFCCCSNSKKQTKIGRVD